MFCNDPLGDMFTRIRNASMRDKSSIFLPYSKLKGWVLQVLLEEGYIRGFEKRQSEKGLPEFVVLLKYHDGRSAISELTRISKPGRRFYAPATSIPLVRNGLGVSIVSTSKGVVSDAKARAMKVGGEVLCTVY